MPHRASCLIDELHRALDGRPWHGPSVMQLLRAVDATQADAHPIPDAHSIGEITAHLTAWTHEVGRRLQGFPPGDPPAGDWPPSLAGTPAGWSAMQLSLCAAVAQVERIIAGFPEARWNVAMDDPRDPAPEDRVTFEALVHGLAQHFAYHGGQIALLTRALAVGYPDE